MGRLPAIVKEKILRLPEYKMGAHRVDLVLHDGSVVRDVIVAWGDEVIKVAGAEPSGFDPTDVVDAVAHV